MKNTVSFGEGVNTACKCLGPDYKSERRASLHLPCHTNLRGFVFREELPLLKIMARTTAVSVWALVIAVVVAGAMATDPRCPPKKLLPCNPAVKEGKEEPSALCCSNLRAQEGCLCLYLHDPSYQRYFGGAEPRKTITSCGIPIPYCLSTTNI
uniref:Bifunctional inhibitor/plant lipid transfer protein/seed storage helical domain-containing protein n=1 Tax=Aegilops tauschii subsp. strangulata TaxID=200361 RepID=A0A453D7T0_AEGTS